jgi:hypothetical protein
VNIEQSSQITVAGQFAELQGHGIGIGMDGHGQWRDNVFAADAGDAVEAESAPPGAGSRLPFQ